MELRRPQMSDQEIKVVQFNRPCPVCDGFMELSSIDSEPWSLRTMGERLRFCCKSCGMTQSEWKAISVDAPSTVPD
jgi:C4-type Zn-finger protein